MAIIMRSKGQTRDEGDKRKQLYTWVGCGLVVVLTLIGVIPNLGGEKRPDYNQFSTRQQDLAALPFGTDAEAGSFLRNNPEYSAISNADLLGSLFSAEDRKERQAKDKAEGVPPPADPEYQAIAKQKAKAEEAQAIQQARIQKQKKATETFAKNREKVINKEKEKAIQKNARQVRNQNQGTRSASLSSGKMVGGSGGSTGVTGSIWRYDDKNIKTGNNSMPSNHALTAQDVAFAKGKGRNVGLDVATIESAKAANAESAETAAASAIDAFQGEVTPEDLEKDAQELGFEELPQGINEDLQDDIDRAINDDLDDKTTPPSTPTSPGDKNNINENCFDNKGNFNTKCWWSKLWSNAASNLVDKVFDCVTSGCWNNWTKAKDDIKFAPNGDAYIKNNKGEWVLQPSNNPQINGDWAWFGDRLFHSGNCVWPKDKC